MFSIRCVLIKVLIFFSFLSVLSSHIIVLLARLRLSKAKKNDQYQRNFLDIEEIDRVRTGEGTGRNETSVMGSSVVFDEI